MTRRSDLILAAFVLAITAMLLVPLPTILLDFLLAANISVALLLLLVGLYMPNALALLAFPSLLLLTTLFRLGLNVASTRLILSQGDAGRVIEAFGSFLIRGEVMVGVIIFTIITIVNFIVIARGASRVSEVAARFALDALPGKQMAIDSDLRAGLIRPEEAQRRREDLRKESQLYGAMDGAMKFVQGDAVAGFFIILTNIIGGLYIGLSQGQAFDEAVRTYTVLTVGDGLVTQIPALLISICAGIVVTRVASGENTTLGADVGSQLFTRPATVLLAGGVMLFVAMLPGLPALPFLVVAGFFGLSAFVLRRSGVSRRAGQGGNGEVPALGGRPSAAALIGELSDSGGLVICLDPQVLHRLWRGAGDRYPAWWQDLRADAWAVWGVRLPEARWASDDRLGPGRWRISIGGTMVDEGAAPLDAVLVEMNPDSAPALGLTVAMEATHPVTGGRVFWCRHGVGMRRILEESGIRTFDPIEFAGLRVATVLRQRPEEIFSLTDMHEVLRQFEKSHAGLVAEAFRGNLLNLSRLTEVFQELVRQGVSIREVRQVIEAAAQWCARHPSLGEDEVDLAEVVSFIRFSRRRQIISALTSGRRTLKVITLADAVAEAFEAADLPALDAPAGLMPGQDEAVRRGLEQTVSALRNRGILPVVVLCRGDLRQRITAFLRSTGAEIPAVAFEELDPAVPVEPAGTWAAAES